MRPEERLSVRVMTQLTEDEARALRRLAGRYRSDASVLRSLLLSELRRRAEAAGAEAAGSETEPSEKSARGGTSERGDEGGEGER